MWQCQAEMSCILGEMESLKPKLLLHIKIKAVFDEVEQLKNRKRNLRLIRNHYWLLRITVMQKRLYVVIS